jgi:hypothetical protein
MLSLVYVQMKINGGGLDAVMTQTALDVGDGMAVVQHVHCPAVTKAILSMSLLLHRLFDVF